MLAKLNKQINTINISQYLKAHVFELFAMPYLTLTGILKSGTLLGLLSSIGAFILLVYLAYRFITYKNTR